MCRTVLGKTEVINLQNYKNIYLIDLNTKLKTIKLLVLSRKT